MRAALILAALALTACGPGPKSGQIVTIGPGPHMTSVHPAYTACGGQVDFVSPGKWRCR